MFSRLINFISNILTPKGYNYLLPECIAVGLPMSDQNEYEFWLHMDGKSDPGIKRFDLPGFNANNYYPPEKNVVKGFTFEERDDNTHFITFDPDYFHLWYAEKPDTEQYFSLYDKTNDIVVLNMFKFIVKRGNP